MQRRVLLVDDDRNMCEMLEAGLKRRGFEVAWCTAADQAIAKLGAADFDAVVTDLAMPKVSGTELCARIVQERPDLPVLVITAFGSLETAVAAIRAGAYDFITKPVEVEALALALDRAVQHHALRQEVKRLRRAVAEARRFEEIVGASPAMQQVFALLEKVAESDAAVLLTGESGTGKDMVARALHKRGRRRDKPFVVVPCAGMSEAMLEVELFGSPRGDRPGLLAQANGGTLFLDEIGSLPPGLQIKLARVLQEKRVRAVDGEREQSVDLRVIASTRADLDAAVEEGHFREDLYFLIHVIHVALPQLRARGGDVLLLAQHFAEHFAARSGKEVAGLSPQAAEKLAAYDWPGNVRELQNCIERAVALTRLDRIAVEDLPDKVRSYQRSHVVVAAEDPSDLLPMDEVERRYIVRVLEAVRGNKTLAARVLGFDRKTLYRKLERYEAMGKADAG
jgi:two-component system response regulator HydG